MPVRYNCEGNYNQNSYSKKNHNRHFLSHNTTPNLKTKIIKLHCPAQKF